MQRRQVRLVEAGTHEIPDQVLVGEMVDRRKIGSKNQIGHLVERLDRWIEYRIATVDATEPMEVVPSGSDHQVVKPIDDSTHGGHH